MCHGTRSQKPEVVVALPFWKYPGSGSNAVPKSRSIFQHLRGNLSTAVGGELSPFIFPAVSRILSAFNKSTPVILFPRSVRRGARDPARTQKHPLSPITR